MIKEEIVYQCPQCGSKNIRRNGKSGEKQKYHCKECNAYGTLNPDRGYKEAEKERILKAYQERGSMRGVERIFGVSRHTLSSWLKKKPKLHQKYPKH